MQNIAAQHKEAGERHESSYADVLRVALRTRLSLQPDELKLLIEQAVADGLLSPKTRASHPMAHLVRLAAGRHERKSTVSRIAAFGQRILEEGRSPDDVLPPGVQFWAEERKYRTGEYRTDKIRVRVTARKGPPSARNLFLDPAVFAAVLAGDCTLRVCGTADHQSLRYEVVHAGNDAVEAETAAVAPTLPDDRLEIDAPTSAPTVDTNDPEVDSLPAPTSEGVPSEPAVQEGNREPGPIAAPADGPSEHPADSSRAGQDEAPADPPPPATQTGSERREVVTIVFGKHVKTNDRAGFKHLEDHGKFRPRSDTDRRLAWTGRRFLGLEEIMRRNAGKIVEADGERYATAA